MADNTYQIVSTVYKTDKYSIKKIEDVYGKFSAIYEVENIESGIVTSFDTQQEAVAYLSSLSGSDTKIYTAPKATASNGSVKETNPPELKAGTEKTVAASGTNRPSTPAIAVGECGPETTIGKTNRELTAQCDWTINLKLDVCGEELKLLAEHWAKRLVVKVSEWLPASKSPIIDDIRNAYKTIKGWMDTIMEYVKILKDLIECITSVINAIAQVVTFIATLPAALLSQSFDCLSKFQGLLEQAAGIQLEPVKQLYDETNTIINETMGSASKIQSQGQGLLNQASTTPTPTVAIQQP
jgi:hypothetical protein